MANNGVMGNVMKRYATTVVGGIIVLLIILSLGSCGALKPETVVNTIEAHAGFPTLSMQVQDCVEDEAEVKQAIAPSFNVLVDKWQITKGLDPELILLELAGAKTHVREASDAWINIKSAIVDANLDCGPAVRQKVDKIETTFAELNAAMLSNQRIVYALEWGDLLLGLVSGRGGTVRRM